MKRTVVIKDAEPIASRGWVKYRPALTFVCAFLADGLQWLLPFLWPVCDGAMVVAVLILWGWRWEVLVAIVPELIPGLELAPTWIIFAGYLVMARRGEGQAPVIRTNTSKPPEKKVEPL
ncbi:MAG: hypothetical protein ABIV50_06970 [Opitutus sp.]